MYITSVSHLLEGELVEAGIDIARSADLSLAMRHDEAHLCNPFFSRVLTSDMDVREGNKPAAWHTQAEILIVHRATTIDFRVEVGRETAIVVRNLDDVGT